MERFIAIFGLIVMMLLAWSMSAKRRAIPWRVIIGGLGLQVALGLFILKTPLGEQIFNEIGAGVTGLLLYVHDGSKFVFGEGLVQVEDVENKGTLVLVPAYTLHYVAFVILPTIMFFSALMSLLYYFGVMQFVVRIIAIIMQKTLGTSGAESLSCAGNIFVGQTEAPLLVRPYLNDMTDSEIMAVMVGGFATVAGGVMATYIGFGISAVHLLTASLMSAPAALVVAKILQPEVEHPKTLGIVEVSPRSEAVNPIDAIARGTTDGLTLALNVGAMLIVFIAMVSLFDGLLLSLTGTFMDRPFSFTDIFGYASAPFAYLMGIEWNECVVAGQILGKRIMTNELIAYLELGQMSAAETPPLSDRSKTILTYALCGFANFSSIGIQIGGLGPLAPNKRGSLVRLGLRAMVGGILACYMTACIASLLIP